MLFNYTTIFAKICLFLGTHTCFASDASIFECVSSASFTCTKKQLVPLNPVKFIDPNKISNTIPTDVIWVPEAFGTCATDYKTLATTGILTCTGLTAFNKRGFPALAHITDVTDPKEALKFLKSFDFDDSKPITLISRVLNERHLLEVKYFIEGRYENAEVILITFPIISSRTAKVTSFEKETLNALLKDGRGISFSFDPRGNHSFFYSPMDFLQVKAPSYTQINIFDSHGY